MSKELKVNGKFIELRDADFDIPLEAEAELDRQMALLDQEEKEVRVNFRWKDEPLKLVQQAAELMGIGYQAYLKIAAYERAVADLQKASSLHKDASSGTEPGLGLART